MWSRRLVAAVSLIVVAIIECAPHRHGDSILESSRVADQQAQVLRCAGPTSGVPHLHRDQVRQIEPCLACFRQHLQATASKITLGTPQIPAHFIVITARIAHARAIRLRKSSRGPPALAS